MNLVRKVHRHHIFALLASPCTEVHRAPRCTTTCVHLHLGASRWLAHRAAPCTECIACAKHPHRDASTSDCARVHGAAPVVTRTLALPARSVGAGGALPAARGHLKGGDARRAGVRGSARKCHCDAGGGQLVLVAVIQPQDEGRVGSHRPRVPGAAAKG